MRHLAYIDPGTGSFIFQAIIGGVAGAVFAFRAQIGRLVGKIAGKKKHAAGHDDE